jgi:hypothetical protein
MKVIGINPNGDIIDYQKLNEFEEVGLVADAVMYEKLWRYHDRRDPGVYKDFDEYLVKDIWEFIEYLKGKDIIKGA